MTDESGPKNHPTPLSVAQPVPAMPRSMHDHITNLFKELDASIAKQLHQIAGNVQLTLKNTDTLKERVISLETRVSALEQQRAAVPRPPQMERVHKALAELQEAVAACSTNEELIEALEEAEAVLDEASKTAPKGE